METDIQTDIHTYIHSSPSGSKCCVAAKNMVQQIQTLDYNYGKTVTSSEAIDKSKKQANK